MKVNYTLRPAKNIERKLIAELCRALKPFGEMHEYRYIGFGSYFFSDFKLFNKMLGITSMVSIEELDSQHTRFTFNRPFDHIELKFGHSNNELPKLSWDMPSIVWLDYEDPLNREVLVDLEFLIDKVQSGTMIFITVNAVPLLDGPPIEILEELIGKDRMPGSLASKDFKKWGTANIFYSVLAEEVSQRLGIYNKGRADEHLRFMPQVARFHYEDGAKMLTVGWVVYDKADELRFQHCKFESYNGYSGADNCYEIELPELTYKEMRLLDTALKTKDRRIYAPHGITRDAFDKYSKVQRYFPVFSEAEF